MKLSSKFIKLIIFILLFTAPLYAKQLTILSFNILGGGTEDGRFHVKENSAWVGQLVQIIRDSNADIVLFQEVPQRLDEENNKSSFADVMVKQLGENWLFRTTAQYLKSGYGYSLNNAIFYKSNSVLVWREIENTNYKFKYGNVQMVEFHVRNEVQNKFYVINLHLPFDRNGIQEPTNDMRRELEALASLVYDRKFPIIYGGDFNMLRRELINESQFSGRYVIDGEGSVFYDNQGLRTTVSSTKEGKTGIPLASDYDHFIVNKNLKIVTPMKRLFDVSSNRNAIKYSKINIGSIEYKDSESYKKGLSDHIPILITIEM